MKHLHPLKVSFYGMSDRVQKVMETCLYIIKDNIDTVIVEGTEAEVEIVDVDLSISNPFLLEERLDQRPPKPIIALSLHEIASKDVIYIKKPLDCAKLSAALMIAIDTLQNKVEVINPRELHDPLSVALDKSEIITKPSIEADILDEKVDEQPRTNQQKKVGSIIDDYDATKENRADRRKSIRYSFEKLIVNSFEISNRRRPVQILNLSSGGALFECNFKLNLKNEGELILGFGKTVYKVPAQVIRVKDSTYSLLFKNDGLSRVNQQRGVGGKATGNTADTNHSDPINDKVKEVIDLNHSALLQSDMNNEVATKENQVDRRKKVRYFFEKLRGYFMLRTSGKKNKPRPVQILNISSKGALIKCDFKLKLKEEGKLILFFGYGKVAYKTPAQVTRIEGGSYSLLFDNDELSQFQLQKKASSKAESKDTSDAHHSAPEDDIGTKGKEVRSSTFQPGEQNKTTATNKRVYHRKSVRYSFEKLKGYFIVNSLVKSNTRSRVKILNISSKGALIECDFKLKLKNKGELILGSKKKVYKVSAQVIRISGNTYTLLFKNINYEICDFLINSGRPFVIQGGLWMAVQPRS